jgi:hypothetical protein
LYTGTRAIDIESLPLTILRATKDLEHMSTMSSIWLSQRERADIETQEMHTKYLSKTQSAREKKHNGIVFVWCFLLPWRQTDRDCRSLVLRTIEDCYTTATMKIIFLGICVR